MATPTSSSTSTTNVFFLLSSLFVLLVAYSISRQSPYRETKLVLYVQDYLGGPDATCAVVGGKRGPDSSALDFGTVVVTDDLLTEGPEPESAPLGRAQGLYANSALDGKGIHMAFSLVFTGGPYNGSTLEVQGSDYYLVKAREFGVVSGTGHFRFARGYGVMETVWLDLNALRGVLKFTITVRHS